MLDPLGLAPTFLVLTEDRDREECRRIALTGVLVAGGVLGAFALVGQGLLSVLGISLAAFRIAGGALLFLFAVEMVFARSRAPHSTTPAEEREARQSRDIAVFPLAIPLIAGPGAITSAMLLTGGAQDWTQKAIVILVLAAVLYLSYLALRSAPILASLLGVTGTNVVRRVLGIVLAALAVQFVVDGVTSVIAGRG